MIPAAAADEIIQWVYDQSDDFIYKVEPKPDFRYSPVKGSFNRAKCSLCQEYVFERYHPHEGRAAGVHPMLRI